jgi:hypothetical protein
MRRCNNLWRQALIDSGGEKLMPRGSKDADRDKAKRKAAQTEES